MTLLANAATLDDPARPPLAPLEAVRSIRARFRLMPIASPAIRWILAAGARLEPLRFLRSGFHLSPVAVLDVGRAGSSHAAAYRRIAANR